MSKFLPKMMLSAALLPLATCAGLGYSPSATAAPQPAPAATPAPALVDADPAMWVVKDADTTVYLFGTVHVLKPGLSWFDEAVKTAFDKSDQLVLEVVLPEDQQAMAGTMMPLAMDQTGKTMTARFAGNPAGLEAYRAAWKSAGADSAMFDRFEPWFSGLMLATLPLAKYGYNPESGAEKQLTAFAKTANKPVVGLETFAEQLGFFDGLSEDVQMQWLNIAVRDIDKVGTVLDGMVEQWAAGNPEKLGELMNKGMAETPQIADVLLYQRNARWADWIKTRLDQPGTVFVAVGAGHLTGSKSVQDYLKDKQIVATRVVY